MAKVAHHFVDDTVYSIKDVSQTYDVSRRTVANWINNGWLKAENVGTTGAQTRWRILGKDLNEFGKTALGERWSSLRGENWKRIHKKI